MITQTDKNDYTYADKRRCRYCSTPMADQRHRTREFCEPYTRPDGTLRNCKDAFYNAIKREEMAPFLALAYEQREFTRALEELLEDKGSQVTVEDVNRKGIRLERHVLRKEHRNDLHTFYFSTYALEQYTRTDFKIRTHELF